MLLYLITTGSYYEKVKCNNQEMIILESFDDTNKIELRKRNEDKFILGIDTYDIIGEKRCDSYRVDVYYSKCERIIERLINDAKTDNHRYGGFKYKLKKAKKIDNEKYTIYQK